MKNKGHIFFITGVTGAGKGTVIKGLTQQLDVSFIKSVKTRPLRKGEIDGVDYIKYSKQQFEEGIENKEFLEYNFVHQQNYYGTRIADIEAAIDEGGIFLKEVDMLILPDLLEAIQKTREHFSFIFLDLPTEEIRNRMLARGDKVDDENYKHRVESSIEEKELAYLADYVIDATKNKEDVLEEVMGIIKKHI